MWMSVKTITAAVGAISLGILAIGAARAADIPISPPQVQSRPPSYYAGPPAAEIYAYPPPPVVYVYPPPPMTYYAYAPPAVGPYYYYGRPRSYGPFIARGYGRYPWVQGYRGW